MGLTESINVCISTALEYSNAVILGICANVLFRLLLVDYVNEC